MKRIYFLLLIMMVINSCAVTKTVRLVKNPKVAAYWTSPTMTKNEADSLANYHLVIADMENMVNNPSNLQAIKKRNPRVKLLAYSNPMELFLPMIANRPLQREILEEVKSRGGWWLRQPNGSPVIFWPGMRMLNLSIDCPGVRGKRYNQWIAQFLLDKVLSGPIWDGYFMDNSGGDVSWIGDWGGNNGIDADNDNRRDNVDILDFSWSAGIYEFLKIIREAKGDDFILVGNKGSLEFLSILDGKMFEEFPNDYLGGEEAGGWYKSVSNYFQSGSFSIIQARQIPNNQKHRLFVLATVLLFDGYYAYGQDITMRFGEYREIGQALGPFQKKPDGSWQREFTKATVRVWPEEKKGEIIYKK